MSRHDRRGIRLPGPRARDDHAGMNLDMTAMADAMAAEARREQMGREIHDLMRLPMNMVADDGRANLAAARLDVAAFSRAVARLPLVDSCRAVLCHPGNLPLLASGCPVDAQRPGVVPMKLFGMVVAADPSMPRWVSRRHWVPPDWGPMWSLTERDDEAALAPLGLGRYEDGEVVGEPLFMVVSVLDLAKRFDVGT